MKTSNCVTAIFCAVLLILTLSICAYAQDGTAAPGQLSAEQLASLDKSVQSLLPLVPVQYKGLIVTGLLALSLLAHLGRVIQGWRAGGFFGALSGLFAGTNAPVNNNPNGNETQTKGAAGLRTLGLFLAVLLPVAMLTGCRGTQVAEAASGSGFKGAVTVPIPYSGGETLLGMSLTVGAWKTVTAVQPTNAALSVVQITDGGQNLAGNAATNAQAGIAATEHDVNALVTGSSGTVTVTNGAATVNK